MLDPALFKSAEGSIIELARALGDTERVLRRHGARIPDFDWYWGETQRQFVRPLLKTVLELQPATPAELQAVREIQAAVDALRSRAGCVQFGVPTEPVKTWGIKPLFEWLSPSWHDTMRRLLLGCVTTNDETLLIVRLFDGRNLHTIPHGHASIHVKTRWRVSIQHAGKTTRIACVRNLRNLDVPWTQRFDEHLPSTFDHASHPFCPPELWADRDTVVQATHTSVPAWIDHFGNGWSPPSTGGGYHWDVYLVQAFAEQTGLSPINVTRWGGPRDQGSVGDLHHVPKKKRPRLRTSTGWTCAS